MVQARILVVDDERGVRTLSSDILRRAGHEVVVAASASEALVRFAESEFDVVLSDIKMPEMDGLELCKRMREEQPEQVVILVTGYPSLETAIEGMKQGARDYITKPFTPDEMRIVVGRALKERALQDENEVFRRELRAKSGVDAILGGSAKMRALSAMIRKVARTNTTILISGESGTGKELVARAIHVHSDRAARPFVPINCGAMVGTLLESELFGHAKGSFTGAHVAKAGLVTAAARGTLFLDEVGELALDMQPKLLRLLQEGEVKAVGAVETKKVDVRVVAATNRDLRQEVQQKTFREDLFYRLNVISIEIPPLRDRPEDIPLLAERFVREAALKVRQPVEGITEAGLGYLQQRPWPGNVRELQNVIERAVILSSGGVIDSADLSDEISVAPHAEGIPAPASRCAESPYPFEGRSLEDLERHHIEVVLRACGGQKSKAAEILGINRTTLWKKLRRYDGVEGEDEPGEDF
ncbi:MAG: sigma-54-dependent Fis family transcriptional regulator [Deltaproteobacteria bacterium]|nr:sigma-54-dependent Fis family transcriptional regulator [Deltaproteobacteria bacterium]